MASQTIEVLVEVKGVNKVVKFTPSLDVPDLDVVYGKLAEIADADSSFAAKLAGNIEFKKFNSRFNVYVDFHKSNFLCDGDKLRIVHKEEEAAAAAAAGPSKSKDEQPPKPPKLRPKSRSPTPVYVVENPSPPGQKPYRSRSRSLDYRRRSPSPKRRASYRSRSPSYSKGKYSDRYYRSRSRSYDRRSDRRSPSHHRDRALVRYRSSSRERYRSHRGYSRSRSRDRYYRSSSRDRYYRSSSRDRYGPPAHRDSHSQRDSTGNRNILQKKFDKNEEVVGLDMLRGKKNKWTWQEILQWEEKEFGFRDNSKC